MFNGLQISLNDLAQIAILYIAIYALIRFVRGTRSAQVLLGFCFLAVVLLGSIAFFRFDVLARIIYFLLIYLALSMVVVFQQEIRRMLALVGGRKLFSRRTAGREGVAEVLCRSLLFLSKSKMGALVAIERGISLLGYESSGVRLKAEISRELMVSIFTPPLPLHDGGIIIRDGRISAAHCIFPVSNQGELITSGMRHRAAVGLSEETDAVVLVVSEETGMISIAHNGRLHRYVPDKVEKILLRWVKKAMFSDSRKPFVLREWISSRFTLFINHLHVESEVEEELARKGSRNDAQ